MSAADMFVPLGSEHACQYFRNPKHKNAFGKLAGSAILTASVLLATQMKSKAADESADKDGDQVDLLQSGSIQTQSGSAGNHAKFDLSVESVLGDLDNTDQTAPLAQIASLGGALFQPSASTQAFASETGIPSGLEVQPPEVTDPGQQTSSLPISDGLSSTASNANYAAGGISASGPTRIDGEIGNDGLSTIILERSTVEQPEISAALLTAGITIIDGPLDTVILAVTPQQLEVLIGLIEDFLALAGPDSHSSDGDTEQGTQLEGTDQDDYLQGTSGDDIVLGLRGNDTLAGGQGADTLIGGDGTDTAVYETSSVGVNIDLGAETTSGGDAEGDVLTSIENLFGSGFMDALIGDNQNNLLHGNAGADGLFGGAGDDTISGGADADHIDGGDGDRDTAIYFTSDAGVSVSLATDTATGGHATGDELDNIENLDGSLHDDFLQGDDLDNRLGGHHGEDVLLGEAGNDTLIGGNLGDFLNGGGGIDTADYTASVEGVYVDLLLAVAMNGEAEGDTLISIENLAGSANNDFLSGDNTDNRLTGRDGDDTLIGNGGNDRLIGGEGADHLDGGGGNRDAADYRNADEAVGVNLEDVGFAGEALGDTYTDIEFVVGSRFDDDISGNAANNRLNGGEGNDTLFGLDGNDTLIGEEGNDTLVGGNGADVFIFSDNLGDDIIRDFEAGAGRTDRIWLEDHAFEDFAELQSSIIDTDDGAYINLEHGSLLLEGIRAAELVQDDFILA